MLLSLSLHTAYNDHFFFRCSLWLKYGLLTDENSVIVVNFIGTCLFTTYVIVFFVFTTNKKLLFRQVTIVVLVLITVLFYARRDGDAKDLARVLGLSTHKKRVTCTD